MAKKDTKTKAAEKKARTLVKQSKKADKKEKKDKRKGKDLEDSDSDDQDLDTILEEYAKQVSCSEDSSYLQVGFCVLHQNLRLVYQCSRGVVCRLLLVRASTSVVPAI